MEGWLSWVLLFMVVAINSCFVTAEIALLTARRSKLQKMASTGSAPAKAALVLYKNPEKLLSTIQVGITLMNILLGMLGGGALSESIAGLLSPIPYFKEYHGIIGDAVVVVMVTYLTVCSELIPKRIAMLHPEGAAVLTSYLSAFFYTMFYPIVMLLNSTTNAFLKILRVKESANEFSLEELKLSLQQIEGNGFIDVTESDMIRRLLNLSDIQVGAVMTPRSEMICLDLQDDEDVNRERIVNHPFNYFPVIEGGLNNIIGIVMAKQFLAEEFSNKKMGHYAKSKEVLYVPEMAKLTSFIQLLRKKQLRIAIVIDEYGGIEGIVTLNDVLKTFVGDLATLADGQKPSVTRRKDGSFIISGSVSVEEVKELLGISALPGEEEEEYRTIASFILRQLSHLPKLNESCAALGWFFKVIRMDKFRITKVHIGRIPEEK